MDSETTATSGEAVPCGCRDGFAAPRARVLAPDHVACMLITLSQL